MTLFRSCHHVLLIVCLAIAADCYGQSFEETFGLRPVRLNMRQVLAGALANSMDVKIEYADFEIAQARIDGASGKFDPVLSLTGARQDSRIVQNAQEYVQTGGLIVPRASPHLFNQTNTQAETSLEWRMPTGTSVVLFSQVGNYLNDLNRQSPPALFSPEQRVTNGVSLVQPLLKDAWYSANLAEIRASRANARIADLQWQQSLSDVIAAVMRDYYALSYAFENVEVRRGVLAFAKTLLHENERRKEAGVGAAVEVEEARVGVATAREEVVSAMELIIQRQRVLKTQLLSVAADVQGILFLPADVLPPAVGSPPPRTRCLADALVRRPDHLRKVRDAEKQDIILKYARNQTLPRLDLKATVSASGLDGSLAGAYQNSLDRQGYNYMVGFEFSVPLGNHKARAARTEAELHKEQALMAVAQSELAVAAEVEEALATWQAASTRLSYARESVTAVDQMLAAEQKRFEQGVARSFDVLRARRLVADARSREIAALADWNAARTALHARTGVLLEQVGVTIEHAEKGGASARLQSQGPGQLAPTP